MIEKEQKLLAQVLDLFSQKFDKRAILRGEMVLKVLGSPRLTNDLDYIFVPYKSKNDIVDDIISCLKTITGATVTHSLNSKCLRVLLTVEQTTIQIEAKVAMDINMSTVSTKLFSSQFNLPPRIIYVTDYTIAMANKLAAWNERRLIRDIYDIWFFLQMDIKPDIATLEKRLQKPCYSRLVKYDDYFRGNGCNDFFDFIRQKVSCLSNDDITDAMSDYLPPEETTDMSMLFRAALVRLNT